VASAEATTSPRDSSAKKERVRYEQSAGQLLVLEGSSLSLVMAKTHIDWGGVQSASRVVSDTLTLEKARIAYVETSLGTHGHVGRGAKWGLLIGLTAGVAIGAIVGASPPMSNDEPSAGLGAVVGGILGAGAGVVSGAIVGAAVRTERWERVPPASWNPATRAAAK
jgi:hypothetical protein